MALSSFEKAKSFDALVARVQACRMCPRMEGRRRVLGYANGSPDTQVLFVAEAPGRLGAERDGKPLWGDRAGKNFRSLLKLSGLKRREIFISNAVLCNPQNKDGNNSPPTTREIKNCSRHMKGLINIIKPKVVVTLGRKALQSLNEVSSHEVDLRRDVAKLSRWNKAALVPLYHCGQQAMISRPFDKQKDDYTNMGKMLKPLLKRSA
ncbi:MAG: uracil-DNA glycosylase [Dehalococcoidia bacterium]|nr:uracil-DNA glycosylase [Dehalococcoidia bacterium]